MFLNVREYRESKKRSASKQPAIYTLLIIFLAVALGFGPAAAQQVDSFRAKLLDEVLSEDHRVSAGAMFNLGQSYLGGNAPADYVRAYMWYTLSAARHKPNTWYGTQSRKKIIPRMTPQQIEQAEQMARQWMLEHWGQTPVSMAAADFEELQQRIVNGDDRALDEIVRRAESGDQAARIELGIMYWENIAVKSDPDKAFYWWTRAAEGGDVEIMTKLGVLYSSGHPGRGIAADPSKGESWLLRAANKGDTAAAHLLTIMYREGKGPVRADLDKYRYWYHKWAEAAARDGDFSVALTLAGYYSGYIDMEAEGAWRQEPAKAAELYKMAAAGGDFNAKIELGLLHLAGRGVERDATAAFDRFFEAAKTDAPIVTVWAHLVVMYEQGVGTEKSTVEAQKLLDRIMAAKQYTAGSLHMIAELYHRSDALPRDLVRAAHYYEMSAVRGKPDAQYQLGQLYWEGRGVLQDSEKAYAWWTIARSNIFDPSMYPHRLVKAALHTADKSLSRSQKSAAKKKARQLIAENESLGIIEGQRWRKTLQKVRQQGKAP